MVPASRSIIGRRDMTRNTRRKFFWKKLRICLVDMFYSITFAPAIEKRRWLLSDSETIFEDTYIIRQVVQETESSISMSTVNREDLGLRWRDGIRAKDIRNNLNNEEFDPGSGWTLATGLTHASRGAAQCSNTRVATGARVSNAYATCLSEGDNPSKDGLIPHETGVPHGDIC